MSPLQFHGEKEFREWSKRMERIKAKTKKTIHEKKAPSRRAVDRKKGKKR